MKNIPFILIVLIMACSIFKSKNDDIKIDISLIPNQYEFSQDKPVNIYLKALIKNKSKNNYCFYLTKNYIDTPVDNNNGEYTQWDSGMSLVNIFFDKHPQLIDPVKYKSSYEYEFALKDEDLRKKIVDYQNSITNKILLLKTTIGISDSAYKKLRFHYIRTLVGSEFIKSGETISRKIELTTIQVKKGKYKLQFIYYDSLDIKTRNQELKEFQDFGIDPFENRKGFITWPGGEIKSKTIDIVVK